MLSKSTSKISLVRSKINSLVGPQEPPLATVKRRKLAWFGHVTHHDSLSKTILQGTLKGGGDAGVSREQNHTQSLQLEISGHSLLFQVQFSSVQSLDRLGHPEGGVEGGHEGRFSRDPFPVFSSGGHCERFWHGQGCPLFDVVHPAFSLPTTASPTFQGALKDGFGEAFVACDMPEPYEFPSLHSCQKRCL